MRNRVTRFIPIVFGLLFTVSLGISLYTIISLLQVSSSTGEKGEIVESHIGLFIPENSYSFFQEVIEGAQSAAEELGVGLSLHRIDSESPDLTMAKYSGITGAVIYPDIPEEAMRALLSELNGEGIPVVLIEHNISDTKPWPYVGTNNFDLGKRIGDLASSIGKDPIEMAVVYSDKSPGIYAERELVEMGILSAFGERSIGTIHYMKTDMNPLEAEDLTSRLLSSSPEVNLIVFTDSNDTLAAAQVVIDMNLVGQVQIIGFGSEAPVLDYISRDVVAGTIAVNPFDIGYRSVEVVNELETEGLSESFVDTGVDIITKKSLPALRFQMEGTL